MRAIQLRCLAAGLALLWVAPTARAQSREPLDVYHFDEEDLIGETLGVTPPLLRVRTCGPRIMLLRPRATFVAELLKSVEDY